MPRDDFMSIYRVACERRLRHYISAHLYLRDFIPVPVSLLNTRRIGGTANQVDVPADVTPDRGQRDVPTDLMGAVKATGGLAISIWNAGGGRK